MALLTVKGETENVSGLPTFKDAKVNVSIAGNRVEFQVIDPERSRVRLQFAVQGDEARKLAAFMIGKLAETAGQGG